MTFLQAAETVLRSAKEPLTAGEGPARGAQAAFCAYLGFGDQLDRFAGDHVAEVTCGWRAVILRSHSVGA